MSDGLGGWDQPAEAVGWQAPHLLLSGPWHACTPPRICPWPDFLAAPDHWHSFPTNSTTSTNSPSGLCPQWNRGHRPQ